ncbi:LysR family transcriptional regulator [Burkholderia sp. WAC0059]|uniref:LysR family transcriptional regulator n=1 Tax=Burkholderia sp. WAC0059 TaxID=2066022 RepID=UPI000C7F555D|nr:LysR family transcriptional regulator [Burkholderia sp. WAC0059]PLZ00490.1 LysR family transcriptional regulator [Burkholderia sp. WAC0059]
MLKLDFDERDLRSLRVFCNAAQAGGFAAAEKRLLMSKASISRHVRQVETRLGVRLCERGPGGFRLTPEGTVALDLASSALRALERIRPEVDAVHGVLSGALTIGIGEHTLTHPQCRLPEALQILRQRAPNVRPEIVVNSFTALNQALLEQRVDIAIRGKYRDDAEFNYLPLYTETHRVYVSGHVANRRASRELPLVYRSHPYVEQALSSGLYKRGPDAGGLDAIGALVASGSYQGILPTHYGKLLEKRFALKLQPDSPSFQHAGCAVTQAARSLSHRAELFLDILRELHPFENGLRMD